MAVRLTGLVSGYGHGTTVTTIRSAQRRGFWYQIVEGFKRQSQNQLLVALLVSFGTANEFNWRINKKTEDLKQNFMGVPLAPFPYWSQRLGKKTLMSYQASERGGEMQFEIVNDTLLIIGQAVIVFEWRLVAAT